MNFSGNSAANLLEVESSLRKSEIRYRRLFEAAHDGVLILDCDSRKITDANPFIEQFLGYGHGELLGKELWEIGLLKDEQASLAAFRELQEKGRVRYEDLPLETKSGVKREVEVVANRYDEDGTQVVQYNIRDITERKRVEAALHASEDRFRTLFASAPMAVFVCDRNAVIQHYNGLAAEFWGREPVCGTDQHCGSTKLWLPDGTLLPHTQSPIVEVLRTGTPAQNVEVSIERPDGSRLPVLVNFAALRNADGEITGAITSFVDITERKLAEDVLRESEDRFRTLFELGPAAIYSCDAAGVIQEFNHRAAELWGRTPAEGDTNERFCGSYKLFHPDGRFVPHNQCPMADVISGKIPEAKDVEVIIERPDKSLITVVVNICPLKNKQGDITGAINCFFDITERKHAEQRQRFLMNELAHRGGNLLAVIQSIVIRSLSGTRPLADERQILSKRLLALARSQSALMKEGFQGAPVAEILRLEFEGFSDRVDAAGPDVLLNSRAAQTFALLVHELATNAAKYGALSGPEKGHIDIAWSIEGEGKEARFRFQWKERGGPLVVPPTRKGFGSVLIEKILAQDFSAQPTIKFALEGFSYEIDAPLIVITSKSAGNLISA